MQIYYIVFALLTIVGGIIGFVSAHSRASLIAGCISGALLLVAGFLLAGHREVGFTLGLLVSVLLAGKFIPDFIHKKAVVPGGMMSVLSIGGVVLTLLAWYRK
jgi:uncharacterized membrane protein (UPF0136 family)